MIVSYRLQKSLIAYPITKKRFMITTSKQPIYEKMWENKGRENLVK